MYIAIGKSPGLNPKRCYAVVTVRIFFPPNEKLYPLRKGTMQKYTCISTVSISLC